MGRYGLRSGYGKYQNIQAGTVDVTLDSNGDGTASVTFKRAMRNAPVVIPAAQTSDDTMTVNVLSKSTSGFTMHCDGATVTGEDITVGYIAMDDITA